MEKRIFKLVWHLAVSCIFVALLGGNTLADPDDSALVSSDYDSTMVIPFKDASTYYIGYQEKAKCRIWRTNSTFVPNHAKTSDDANVTHWHIRYDYGDGPTGDPYWGSTPSWPEPQDGNDFWDWMFESQKDGSGTGITAKRNCISYAFDNYGGATIADDVWVDSDYTYTQRICGVVSTHLSVLMAAAEMIPVLAD